MNFGNNSQLFITKFPQKTNNKNFATENVSNSNLITLTHNLSDICKIIPRFFTITTKNSSAKFNLDVLIDISIMVSSIIKKDPQVMHYKIDIEDNRNVLGKFERLFQGEKVIFEKEDLPICQLITEKLRIYNCPDYMVLVKRYSLSQHVPSFKELDYGVAIDGLKQFFNNKKFQRFTILTKKNKYKCNIFGVCSSEVILNELVKYPRKEEFFYDINDDFDEFQLICNIFNFQYIEITNNNMYSLKEISEDLQIKFISEGIEKFINDSEKVSQMIDNQETNINSINEVFDWLYNIKEKTVDFVKKSIIESSWIETEENVQELAAFILETVQTDFLLHPYLCDLLIQLNEEAKETNFLKILIPFIKRKLFDNHYTILYSSSSAANCIVADYTNTYAFIYRFYKNALISKEEIIDFIHSYCDTTVASWFLPIIVKNNLKVSALNNLYADQNDSYYNFMKPFLYDKIDLYEKMLDEGEPDDCIIKSLRHDNVDELQSIITKSRINVKKCFISSSIFDSFYRDNKITYLNYAAAYGSIKCFKYLLLNQYCDIDKNSFKMAIFGGNNEIIKIVDQRMKYDVNHIRTSECPSEIIYTIKKHQNNLFDWIIEKNFDFYKKSFDQIALESAEQGNAHSLITIIDKGYDISNEIENVINIASKKGFYKLTKILLKFKENIKNKKQPNVPFNIQDPTINYVYFGNLSIYKLFMNQLNMKEIDSTICFAISKNYLSIIDYFFEVLSKNEIKFTRNSAFLMLNKSLNVTKEDKQFLYLLEKIKNSKPDLVDDVLIYTRLLINACKYLNFKAAKTITDIIYDKKQDEDFSQAFIVAASVRSNEICQYFVDKKVRIDYDKLSPLKTDFTELNINLFSLIMNKANPKMKPYFLGCIDRAIENKNKDVVEYLFSQNAESKNALILAVDTNNLEIVNTVLKFNCKPYFINMIRNDGTALIHAVSNQNIQIVKRLLSIPKIDPSLYQSDTGFPLIIAIKKKNLEIVNAILDFYGDDIQFQTEQLDEAVKIVLDLYCSNLSKKNDKISSIINRILEIKYINPNLSMIQNKTINYNKKSFYDDSDDDYSDDSDDENYEEYNNYQNNHQNNILTNQGCITFLLYACLMNDIKMVKLLLKLDKINVNQYSLNMGDTPLLISLEQKNLEIVELLIKHPKTNINHRDFYEQTPLIIAVQNELYNIVDLLINDQRFDAEESRLNYAFVISNYEIATKLIELKSLDINYNCKIQNFKLTNQQSIIMNKPLSYPDYSFGSRRETDELKDTVYKTALINAIEKKDIEKINLIIYHHSFDKVKSQIENAIIISTKYKNIDLFKNLMMLINDDVNLCDIQNQTLLFHAIDNLNEEVINYILNNNNFDSKKSDILNAFVEIYNGKKFYGKVNLILMNTLIMYDNEHNHLIDFNKLLPNGKSFFTSIEKSIANIYDVSNFLLEHGVDPNKPDKYYVFPLEKAINLNSPQFVLSLIDSNKIDFTVKIPKKPNKSITITNNSYITYLHLALMAKNDQILSYLLDRDLIDINITDNLGNTALMEACINKQISKIDLLFKKDNLDYLHKNNQGDDALSLAMGKKYKRKVINTKKEYLLELKKALSKKKYY